MAPEFTHPTFHGTTFDAVGYGEPWNGFATPVVDDVDPLALLGATHDTPDMGM